MGPFRSACIALCVVACGTSGGEPIEDAAVDHVVSVEAGAEAAADSSVVDAGKLPATCPEASKTARYVSVSGSDGSPGSATSPYATIQHAIDLSGPGDVIHVLAGTYTGTTSPLAYVRTQNSGTASEPVVLCSDPPLAAKLDGQNTLATGFYLEGPSTQVIGFEVTGFVGAGASVWSTDDRLVGNVIHDIGHVCSDSDLGKVGIYTSATNVVIDRNVIHTIGRLSPGEQGCAPTNTNYQNHDHAIYVESSTSVLVSNNVFYDNQHGWDVHVYSSSGPGSSGLTIVNNTFAFPNPYRDGQVLFSTPAVSSAIVENNVFYEPQTEGVHFGSGGAYSNVTVKNNLTTGAPTTVTSSGGTVVVTGNVDSTDALLVSPSTDDFHLEPTSPAIDHGLTLTTVTTDIDGTPRPQGSAYDLGAYEWHP